MRLRARSSRIARIGTVHVLIGFGLSWSSPLAVAQGHAAPCACRGGSPNPASPPANPAVCPCRSSPSEGTPCASCRWDCPCNLSSLYFAAVAKGVENAMIRAFNADSVKSSGSREPNHPDQIQSPGTEIAGSIETDSPCREDARDQGRTGPPLQSRPLPFPPVPSKSVGASDTPRSAQPPVPPSPPERSYSLTLAPGQVAEDVNFAVNDHPKPPVTIRGVKWLDRNGNGTRDQGEAGCARSDHFPGFECQPRVGSGRTLSANRRGGTLSVRRAGTGKLCGPRAFPSGGSLPPAAKFQPQVASGPAGARTREFADGSVASSTQQ